MIGEKSGNYHFPFTDLVTKREQRWELTNDATGLSAWLTSQPLPDKS